ncbi:protein DA1 [Rhodococcus sp. WS3]|uniref:protein DA1 n=1 Tax=Rhodococcus sp. WS3 TaxID=2486271 RepID=UPI0011440A64|nr:protein DA1 [Rhodococcus sp. WS3]
MTKRELAVPTPVRITLADSRRLASKGLNNGPHHHGVTEIEYFHGTTQPTNVEITVRMGLPDIQCRATVAHEFGHAFMAHQCLFDVPLVLSEGFAELASYAYLYHDVATVEARAECRSISRRPDLYGVGFRRVYEIVKRIGLAEFIRRLQVNPTDDFVQFPTQ